MAQQSESSLVKDYYKNIYLKILNHNFSGAKDDIMMMLAIGASLGPSEEADAKFFEKYFEIEILRFQHKFNEGRDKSELLLREFPDNLYAIHNRALFCNNHPAQKEEYARKILKMDVNMLDLEEKSIFASAMSIIGDAAGAQSLIEKIREESQDQDDILIRFRQASIYCSFKEYKKLAEILPSLEQELSNNPSIFTMKGVYLQDIGDAKGAIACMEKSALIFPNINSFKHLYSVYKTFPQEAISYFKNIISQDPNSSLGYFALANVYLDQVSKNSNFHSASDSDLLKKAMENINKACSIDSNKAEYVAKRADIAISLCHSLISLKIDHTESLNDAIKYLESYRAFYTNQDDIFKFGVYSFNLGDCYYSLGNYSEAIKYFQQDLASMNHATEFGGNHFEIYAELAKANHSILACHMNMNSIEYVQDCYMEALRNIDIAISISPNSFKPYHLKSRLLKEMYQNEELLDLFEIIITKFPDQKDFLYHKIFLKERLGLEISVDEYDLAISNFPSSDKLFVGKLVSMANNRQEEEFIEFWIHAKSKFNSFEKSFWDRSKVLNLKPDLCDYIKTLIPADNSSEVSIVERDFHTLVPSNIIASFAPEVIREENPSSQEPDPISIVEASDEMFTSSSYTLAGEGAQTSEL